LWQVFNLIEEPPEFCYLWSGLLSDKTRLTFLLAGWKTTMKKAQVRLYTRPGCHLCEEARAAMLDAGCADEYELEVVNINTDPALKSSYGLKIPVITINGREAFVYRLSPAEFKQQIRLARTD
jgi:glutaredoxin